MKKLVLFLIVYMFTQSLFSQTKDSIPQNKKKSNHEVIVIQTSGHCQSCKEKIENGLAYEKGIKDVVYDLNTAKVSVTYDPQKTNPNTIRSLINNLGYDADQSKAKKTDEKNCNKEHH